MALQPDPVGSTDATRTKHQAGEDHRIEQQPDKDDGEDDGQNSFPPAVSTIKFTQDHVAKPCHDGDGEADGFSDQDGCGHAADSRLTSIRYRLAISS
jgi:hypothetical protein